MATITTVSHGSYPQTPRRTYLTSSNYNTFFFQITSNMDPTTYQWTYSMNTVVTGAVASNCPRGAYLRETGKKIYPGQYSGINTYFVSVFDDSSHLTGYINPNASVFLPLNTDKPLNVLDMTATTGASDDKTQGNLGPSIYTAGNAVVGGYVSTSKLYVDNSSTARTAGVSKLASGASTITTTAISNNSVILLNYYSTSVASMTTSNVLFTSSINSGSRFTIGSANTADANWVNWFIVN